MAEIQQLKKYLPLALLLLVIPLAFMLLSSEAVYFFSWWLLWTVTGLIFWPLASFFIPGSDAGYALAKILGPVLITLTVSFLSSASILPFQRLFLLMLFALAAALIWGLPPLKDKFAKAVKKDLNWNLIAAEELIFALLLLLWTFARGLKPELDSLEKMMNLGFINSLWRSDTLPALDMWFAGGKINYYYGGHILTTIMIKLSNLKTEIAYNLALASTMALTGCLGFSLGFQLLTGQKKKKSYLPWLSGGLVSLLVSFAGNGHAFFYDNNSPGYSILKRLAAIFPAKVGSIASFWFSDSTRYIGHNPPADDFTIHEFPYYSFLVADLHAHLLNLAAVLGLLIIIAAAWKSGWFSGRADLWHAKIQPFKKIESSDNNIKSFTFSELRHSFSDPYLLIMAAFLASFMMTNYWDFAIYFALISWLAWKVSYASALPLLTHRGLLVFLLQFALLLLPFLYLKSAVLALFLFALAALVNHYLLNLASDRLSFAAAKVSALFALAHLIALPFNLNFEAIAKNIKLTDRHSSTFQFLIVWGIILLAVFSWWLCESYLTRRKKNSCPDTDELKNHEAPLEVDANCLTLASQRQGRILNSSLLLAAVFLLIIPELIYVQDIYGPSYQRSNTMFKFTYQAFVLLMIVWAVAITRLLLYKRPLAVITAILLIFLTLIPLWYPWAATEQWLGKFRRENYQTIDGSVPIRSKNSEQIPGDEAGELKSYFTLIDWINENIDGQPVIVEAVSISYSDFNLISSFTGLPTIIGWPTHEWLWRQTVENEDAWGSVVAPRIQEVEMVYRGEDRDLIKDILARYEVKYIVIGALERVCYSGFNDIPVANEIFLRSLGELVFDQNGTSLIEIRSEN